MKKISRNKFSGLSHLASKAGLGGGGSTSSNNSSTPPPPSSATQQPPTASSSSSTSSSTSSGGVSGLLRRPTWADKVREKLPELGENEYEVPWERGVLGVIFLESEKGGVPYVSKATESCISPLVHAGDVLRCVNDVRSQDHSFSEFFKILATMKKPVLLRFERPASSTTSSDGEDSPLEQRSSSAVGIGIGSSGRPHATSDSTPKVLRSNSVPQGESQPKSQRSAFWRTVSAKDPPAPAPAPAPAPLVTTSDPRATSSARTLGGNHLTHQASAPMRDNGEYSHGFVDTRQFEVSPRIGYGEPAATDPDHYEYEVYWETGSLGLFFGEDRITSLPVVTRSTPNANSVVQRMVAVNDTLVSANDVQSRNYSFEAFFARLQQMKKPVRLVFRRKIDPMSPAPGSARARVASVTVDTLPSPGEHSARRLPTPPRPMPSVGEQLNGSRTPPESPAYERGSVRESRREASSGRGRKTELDIDTSASPPVALRSSPTPAVATSANGSDVSASRRTLPSPLNLARASAAIVAPRTSPTPAEAATTRVSDPTAGRAAAVPSSLDLAGASAAIVAPRASVRVPKAPVSAPEPSPSSRQAAPSSLNLASASAAIMSTRSEPRRSGSESLSPGSSWEDASENGRSLQSESPKQQKRSTSVPSPPSSAPVVQRQSSSSSPTPTSGFSQSQTSHSKRSRTLSPHSVSRQSEPALAFDAARPLSPPSPSSPASAIESSKRAESTSLSRVESQHVSPTRSSITGASSPPSSPKRVAEVDVTTSGGDDNDWIASPKAADTDVISPTAIEGQVRMSAEGLSMWEEDGVEEAAEEEAPEDDAPVSRSSWDEPLDIEGDDFDAEGKALDDEFEYLMEKMQEQAKASSGGGRALSEDVVVGVEMGIVADVAIGVAVEAAVPQPVADDAGDNAEIVFVAAEPLTVDPLVAEIVPLDALPTLGEVESEEGQGTGERSSDLESELESNADAGLSDDGSDMLDAIEQDIIADIDGNDLMPQVPKLKSGGTSLSPFKANRATVHANLAKYKRRPKNSRAVTKLPRLTEDTALTVPLVAPNAVNTTVQVRGRSKPKPSMQETPDSTTYLVKWKETRSIGLQLKEVRLAKGVFPLVTDVCQEPCCELLKHVCVGDVIMEINGRNTSLMGVKKTVGFLKTCSKTTLLKLRHGPGYVPQRVSALV